MNLRLVPAVAVGLFLMLAASLPVCASDSAQLLEQSMSDTLDLWREGRYEQLFERLARRGKTSREVFVKKMHHTNVRPACCWQKMENFKVLNEKRTEATIYVKVGLEGTPNASESSTREFKLTHEGGVWKMQLSDIFSIAGVTAKKNRHSQKKVNKELSHHHK
ncbi:MAG: hypothetical protein HY888_06355 [Deltaproteobacteria bacterium]|nr:hypothetical protein [Deltaproteobacteria bacterium]